MNNIIKGSMIGALTCAISPSIIKAAEPEQRPNILFILVDDFRFDALGYCGNPIVQTPAIDDLASNGVYFNNAFASTPISSASRASILTGLQERTHRYSFQTGPLEDRLLEQAYPLALREAGYNTALFGKLGVVCTDAESLFDEIEDYDRDDTQPNRRGYFYKQLDGDTVHLTRYTGQKGLDYLDKQTGDEPFFLSLCFSAPHAHDGAKEQYFWDENQADLFKDVTIPDPMMSDDKYFERLPEFLQQSFSRLRWTWRFDEPEKYQEMMKGYYRMIAGVDQEIAKVKAKLKEKGLDKNTVIILMGDNGYFLGERQLADKWLMYDLSVRIPMIIYDPRTPNHHKEVTTQALNIDLPATFADYAGAQIAPQWQGESLRQLVEQNDAELERDAILIEHLWEMPKIPSSEGVRTANWKYFRYINDKRVEELYDLENDPNEEFNLVDKKRYAQKLNELRAMTDSLALAKAQDGSDAPFNIKADYSSSVCSSHPTFSWCMPLRAQSQKGYQILVASSQELINCNIGDMWNSGVVSSTKSTSAKYEGKNLEVGKEYYWRVRIWDFLNRTTEYSEVQKVTIDPTFEVKAPAAMSVKEFTIDNNSACASDKPFMASVPLMLWGAQNEGKDCASLNLEPKLEGASNSNITIETLRGDVECNYTRVTPLVERYSVTIPANMSVEFVLPAELSASVILNKKVQNLNHRRLQLQPGKNDIELQVNTF